jgi:hypothetical protein
MSTACPTDRPYKSATGKCFATQDEADAMDTGGRRRTMKVKTLRRMLKAKGKKTTGKKATLMKRLHLRGGGPGDEAAPVVNTGGRRRRSRRREEEGGRRRRSRGLFHF